MENLLCYLSRFPPDLHAFSAGVTQRGRYYRMICEQFLSFNYMFLLPSDSITLLSPRNKSLAQDYDKNAVTNQYFHFSCSFTDVLKSEDDEDLRFGADDT